MSASEPRREQPVRLAPILFSTTNVAKLLQARLILGSHGLEVVRLERHRQPYREPYGLPKRDFLRAGLDQVRSRAGLNRLVFIEDTTVSFPTLNRNGKEFPGQETKEWFAEAVHSQLLEQLDAAGPSRSAIVSSDLLLHVPGFTEPLLFSALTEGRVVDRVERVTPNRLYPWLGQPDFSSWFVPVGASRPLASMRLEESLQYDFRAKALTLLAQRLSEYLATLNLPSASVRNPASQSTQNPDQLVLFDVGSPKCLIIVTGAIASGKTTVGHHLSLHRSFSHIEGSRALGVVGARLGFHSYVSHFELADSLFERFGHEVVERELVVPEMSIAETPIVYTGCRTVEGIAALKKAARALDWEVFVLFVSTPSSLRLSRAVERVRRGAALDPLQFYADSARDEAYGAVKLGGLIADAEIGNAGDRDTFLVTVDRVVTKLRSGVNSMSARRKQVTATLEQTKSPQDLAGKLARISDELVLSENPVELSLRGESLLSVLMDAGELHSHIEG